MAFETPFHLQRRRLVNNRHLIDLAVTRRTADTFIHVNTVIEVDIIREVVHANPLDRLARLKARAHRFQRGTVGPDLFMTIHANRG